MENKELPESLVEEAAKAIYQKISSIGINCDAASKAALSVIAPYYEKQIAELHERKLELGNTYLDFVQYEYNPLVDEYNELIDKCDKVEKQIAELKAQNEALEIYINRTLPLKPAAE